MWSWHMNNLLFISLSEMAGLVYTEIALNPTKATLQAVIPGEVPIDIVKQLCNYHISTQNRRIEYQYIITVLAVLSPML